MTRPDDPHTHPTQQLTVKKAKCNRHPSMQQQSISMPYATPQCVVVHSAWSSTVRGRGRVRAVHESLSTVTIVPYVLYRTFVLFHSCTGVRCHEPQQDTENRWRASSRRTKGKNVRWLFVSRLIVTE
jgi:hypothetical protein